MRVPGTYTIVDPYGAVVTTSVDGAVRHAETEWYRNANLSRLAALSTVEDRLRSGDLVAAFGTAADYGLTINLTPEGVPST